MPAFLLLRNLGFMGQHLVSFLLFWLNADPWVWLQTDAAFDEGLLQMFPGDLHV